MKMLRDVQKRAFLFVMAVAMAVAASTPERAEAAPAISVYTGASPYEAFQYNTDEYNAVWIPDYVHVFVNSWNNDNIGLYSFVCGLARAKSTDSYIFMVRQVMTPLSGYYSQSVGQMAQKGYGLSEYCSFDVVLPSLDEYTPKNTPAEDVIKTSISASTDLKATVNLQYDIRHNDVALGFTSNLAQKKYGMTYDYKPHVINPFASNAYFRNPSDQNCMAKFRTNKKNIHLNVNYEARFGASATKNANAIAIAKGVIYSKKGTFTLNFPVVSKE